MSTGEKVSPNDLELAITEDPLFDQAMVVGEGKPYLAALIVLNPEAWREWAQALSVDANDPQSLRAPTVLKYVRERLQGTAAQLSCSRTSSQSLAHAASPGRSKTGSSPRR